MHEITQSPLGKSSIYVSQYQSGLLFPIQRKKKREELKLFEDLPFKGVDVWTGYELSWLNLKGKPIVALAQFIFPCESPNLVESKSLKLYLNSFTNTKWATLNDVKKTMQQDLSKTAGATVLVEITPLHEASTLITSCFEGVCLDSLDVECNTYAIHPDFLETEDELTTETVYSDLLKSNCLVTGQPDWGSVQISYTGPKIQHEGLLKYLVSFRNHNEFHEHCVERIFMDMMQRCKPTQLTVYARYTRRGGLDINPFRSTEYDIAPKDIRLIRQ